MAAILELYQRNNPIGFVCLFRIKAGYGWSGRMLSVTLKKLSVFLVRVNWVTEDPASMPPAVIYVDLNAVNSRFFCEICQHFAVANFVYQPPIF